MKILHIDASIRGSNSVSREVTAAIVNRLKGTNTDVEVRYRDLVETPPAHTTLASLPGDHPASVFAGPLDSIAQRIRDESQQMLDEFLAADTVVLGVPTYNFGVPSQLKAWIDNIVVPGKTFAFGPEGPQGLAGDKRVIVVIVRGGIYPPERAAISAEGYLRTILTFVGVNHPEFIVAEGVAGKDENRAKALASALDAVEQIIV